MVTKWIQPMYAQAQAMSNLKSKFQKAKPFRHLEVHSFFQEEKLQAVLKELLSEKFYEKHSDLFQFKQTADLKNTKKPALKSFIQFLYSKEFVQYMQDITGFTFTNTMDVAGTLYQDTDFLLCHDDELEGRKIAFLIYLSTVEEKDGGSLALYDSKTKKPNKIVKQITPTFNKLAFFEVSPISFHEVLEVVVEKDRIAIGGWYYAK
jgi:Rps23 Pro-64 3,4-dihydroxylase Tpa1-like proline 4-hydroxylase